MLEHSVRKETNVTITVGYSSLLEGAESFYSEGLEGGRVHGTEALWIRTVGHLDHALGIGPEVRQQAGREPTHRKERLRLTDHSGPEAVVGSLYGGQSLHGT